MIPFPLWAYVALGGVLASLFGVVQTHRLHSVQKEYAAFVANVKATGEAQEKATKETNARNVKAKEAADVQNARLKSANNALSASLLNARAGAGYLPRSSPGTVSADTACFSRTEFESAMGHLDAGASRLVGKGDEARTDLDTARDWLKAR